MYVYMYVCMYVCMCVCMHNRIVIEIYGFTDSLHTFLARAANGASASTMEDLEDRRRWQARE